MARRPFKEVNAEFRALVKQELNMLTPQDLALVETTRKKAADRMFLAISVLILAIGAVILLIIRENQTDESIYLLPTPLAGICLGWAVKTILLYYKPEASVMRAARARALEKASPELREAVTFYEKKHLALAPWLGVLGAIVLIALMIGIAFLVLALTHNM